MAYALSAAALSTAAIESYSVISHSDILPPLIGPVLAIVTICSGFAYAFATREKRQELPMRPHDTFDSYKKHLRQI
jgi:hypothetical protein